MCTGDGMLKVRRRLGTQLNSERILKCSNPRTAFECRGAYIAPYQAEKNVRENGVVTCKEDGEHSLRLRSLP